MKTHLSFLLSLWFASAFASPDTIDIKTVVTDVTVFLQGAQITRTGTVQLKPGKQLIEIPGLPVDLNPQSIQVDPVKNGEILTVSCGRSSLRNSDKDPAIAGYEQSIRKLRSANEDYTDQ